MDRQDDVGSEPRVRIIRVIDGDSLTCHNLDNGRDFRLRLFGIDAQEQDQRYGVDAAKALARMTQNGIFRLEVTDADRYGRLVGILRSEGDRAFCVNTEMVAQGWAFNWTEFGEIPGTASAQESAKVNRRGMWWNGDPEVRPWQNRRPDLYQPAPQRPPIQQPSAQPQPVQRPSVPQQVVQQSPARATTREARVSPPPKSTPQSKAAGGPRKNAVERLVIWTVIVITVVFFMVLALVIGFDLDGYQGVSRPVITNSVTPTPKFVAPTRPPQTRLGGASLPTAGPITGKGGWNYDTNGDERFSRAEMDVAISDHIEGRITRDELTKVFTYWPTPLPKLVAGYDPHGEDRDCADFDTQADAQRFFIAAGGPEKDPHQIEGDKDGIACESLLLDKRYQSR